MDPSLELRRDDRDRVAADSAMLRKLMTALLGATRAALRDERQRPVLRASIAKLRAEVERHLDFEERVLFPLLREADGWGPRRAERTAAEHDAQRAMLAALAEGAGDVTRPVAELADEIARFVRRFERSLSEEPARRPDERERG